MSSGRHSLHSLVHPEAVQETQDVRKPQLLRVGGRLDQVALNRMNGRAGEMAQLLRALAALTKVRFPALTW